VVSSFAACPYDDPACQENEDLKKVLEETCTLLKRVVNAQVCKRGELENADYMQ
jgi:hypothetical protein